MPLCSLEISLVTADYEAEEHMMSVKSCQVRDTREEGEAA